MRSSSITTISSAMVMAAGLGTRLRPFTLDTPKPLLPLMGAPILQYSLDALQASGCGFKTAVINHSHLSGKLRSGVAGLESGPIRIDLSDESHLLMGSAGGLRKALPLLGESHPFLLMNGDVICDIDLGALINAHMRLRQSHGVQLTLAVHRRSPGAGTYREIQVKSLPGFGASTGKVCGLGEIKRQVAFFSGFAVVEPSSLLQLPSDRPSEFVPSLLSPAIEAGLVGAFLFEDPWIDIGSPELWLDAHLEIMRRMETGQIPQVWKKRVEATAIRHAQGIWGIKQGATPTLGPIEQCLPPVFLGCDRREIRQWERVGPSAVVYGAPSFDDKQLANGITWNGRTWRRPV